MKYLLTAVSIVLATQAMADDTCLEGTWAPDYNVMGDQLLRETGATGVIFSGDVFMVIFDGSGRYDVRRLESLLTTEGMPPTTVTITGYGQFDVLAAEGVIETTMGDFAYNARATIDIGGAPMVMDIPLTDEMAPFGSMIGGYTCSENDLTIHPLEGGVIQTRMVNHWFRVPNGS